MPNEKKREGFSTEDLTHEDENTDVEPVVLTDEEMYTVDTPDPDFVKGIRKDG